MIMVPRGSSNRKARQRHPAYPQKLIQMQQHDGKRSKTEVGHENNLCPHDLARIHIQTQQKAALKRVKSRVPKRVSMEDDDMFTMFLWTTKTMDLSEKSIDFERETYQKTLRQDSLKKRTPIRVKDIFGDEELKKVKPRLSLRHRLSSTLSSSFGYNTTPAPDRKTKRKVSFFGLSFRRDSNSLRASLCRSQSKMSLEKKS